MFGLFEKKDKNSLGENELPLNQFGDLFRGDHCAEELLLSAGQLATRPSTYIKYCRYLTSRNLKNGRIVKFKDDKFVKLISPEEGYSKILKRGDIVFSLLFNEKKISYYEETGDLCWVSNNLIILRSSESDYLLKYFKVDQFFNQFKLDVDIQLTKSQNGIFNCDEIGEIKLNRISDSNWGKLFPKKNTKIPSAPEERSKLALQERSRKTKPLKKLINGHSDVLFNKSLSEQIAPVRQFADRQQEIEPRQQKIEPELPSGEEKTSQKDIDFPQLKESLNKGKLNSDQLIFVSKLLDDHFSDEILKLSTLQESQFLEFKSSFRTDIDHSGKIPEDTMIHNVLKSICGFCNTGGGDLLIGVSDYSEIIGIEIDNYKNTDEFIRTLYKQISNLTIPDLTQMSGVIEITTTINLESKTVCRVKVAPSFEDVFVKYRGKEIFYIRKGPSNDILSGSELLRYSKERRGDWKSSFQSN